MARRISWGARLAAILTSALAAATLAAPARAQHLVFDVTITSYADSDINGNTTTTPFSLQYAQTFVLGGLPAPGSSAFQVQIFPTLPLTIDRNIVGTNSVTAGSTPVDAFLNGLAPAQTPLVASQVEFQAVQAAYFNNSGEFDYQSGVDLQISNSYQAGDGVTHAIGSDSDIQLSNGGEVNAPPFPPTPTPLTVSQMIGLLGGVWSYSYLADGYDLTLAPDGSASGYYALREYNGFATLDASQSSLVPEAQAWALMILGFGAMGAGFRRRRSLAAA